MRCLNPDCGSPVADELNVSVNVSSTAEQDDLEYLGDTDWGDPLVPVGTWCSECERRTLSPGWLRALIDAVRGD